MGEFDLIRWIRRQESIADRVSIGIGDDCASMRVRPGFDLLATTDMLMEGRHFLLESASPREVGYKTLAVNLSDIAAMAGWPVAALVAVALPRDRAESLGREIHQGMAPLAKRFGVALIGGDTNAWTGPLVISVTLLGEVEIGRAVTRSGARVGDAIYVTGPLGGSLLGRHLHPEPRIREARALVQQGEIHAMIDLSDGLSSDLGHILQESGGLGAILDEDAIPIHDDARLLASQDGRSALEHALHDGEDFELCFTVEGSENPSCPVALFRIGQITAEPSLRLMRTDGTLETLRPSGFDHFRA